MLPPHKSQRGSEVWDLTSLFLLLSISLRQTTVVSRHLLGLLLRESLLACLLVISRSLEGRKQGKAGYVGILDTILLLSSFLFLFHFRASGRWISIWNDGDTGYSVSIVTPFYIAAPGALVHNTLM